MSKLLKLGTLFVSSLVLGMILAACSTATAQDTPSTAAAGCSAPAGTELLTNAVHGYCLAYPSGYAVEQPNENETVIFVGSLLDVEHPKAFIKVEDAMGRTAEQLAAEIEASFPGFPIERASATIGGQQAIVLDKLPGQDMNRQILALHDGRLYTLTFLPADERLGDIYAQMEDLYTAVLNSFHFVSES